MWLGGCEAEHGRTNIMRDMAAHLVDVAFEVCDAYAIKALEMLVRAQASEQAAGFTWTVTG